MKEWRLLNSPFLLIGNAFYKSHDPADEWYTLKSKFPDSGDKGNIYIGKTVAQL